MKRLVTLLLAFFTTALFAGPAAADSTPGEFIWSVSVPDGFTREEVKDLIIMTVAGRSWGLREKTDEKIVAHLKHRSNEATVTLLYNEKKVDLYSVGYEINKRTGERKKPEQPTGWLNNLQSDLNKKINQATATK